MITVYSKPNCPYCDAAKAWFEHHEIAFTTVDITADEAARAFVVERGHRTVPQIYGGQTLLVEGGYTGLKALTEDQIALLRAHR